MSKDFGPFEIVKKIGGGGMASVHLAVQKSLDRQVVLKIIYPHLAEDEKLVARFEREARAAAMMRHENIVQVIDCGVYADQPYIAMEFVEGLDLKRWMEQHGAPPLEMALLMLRDICRGLEHAHGHRIVHRDIKPANIMLTSDGMIKIMDFGLARRGEETTAVTVMGSVLGTPAYMSPEQASGAHVDERGDIFSTGVVAYELLGGRRPFQGESYSALLQEILNVEPPALESLNPTVPPAVVRVIHKIHPGEEGEYYAEAARALDWDPLKLTTIREPRLYEILEQSDVLVAAYSSTVLESLALCTPAIVFDGPVREGARLYPQNVNISAAAAIAGLGLDRTRLVIVADPTITTHIVELEAAGAFGRFSFREEVAVSEENRKTGKLVAMAMVKSVRQLASTLVVAA